MGYFSAIGNMVKTFDFAKQSRTATEENVAGLRIFHLNIRKIFPRSKLCLTHYLILHTSHQVKGRPQFAIAQLASSSISVEQTLKYRPVV